MMPMGMIFGVVHRKVNVKKINLAISEQVVRYLLYLQENPELVGSVLAF